MPTKKKKFNARFPPARIKKIMQTDEEVGKVAAPVPVIISKALEMFMQTLVEKACNYTQARNAKTLSTAHLKRCITSEQQFDFLKDLVENIPDLPADEEEGNGEPKPKRKKAQPSANKDKQKPKKREKKKDKVKLVVSDESDEDIDSEEEESVSSSSHSNPSTSVNNATVTTVPTITVSKADHDQDEVFEPPPSTSLPIPPSFSHKPLLNTGVSIEEDDDYDS